MKRLLALVISMSSLLAHASELCSSYDYPKGTATARQFCQSSGNSRVFAAQCLINDIHQLSEQYKSVLRSATQGGSAIELYDLDLEMELRMEALHTLAYAPECQY